MGEVSLSIFIINYRNFESMTTVPKLSYTNLKSKNRLKNEESQDLSLSSRSSDLFAHMNKDNLAYIQNQIKEKRKKNNLMLSRQNSKPPQPKKQSSSDPDPEEDYPPTPQLLSPTIQTNLPVVKTEGQNSTQLDAQKKWVHFDRKFSHAEPQILPNNSHINLNKPNRLNLLNMSDLQQETSPNEIVHQNSFLSFLENYIDDLNAPKIQSNIMNKHKKLSSESFQMQQKEDLQKKFKKNQKANKSHEFPQYGYSDKLTNTKRIEKLEQQMMGLIQEVHLLRNNLKTQNQETLSNSHEYFEREARSISAFGSQYRSAASRNQKRNTFYKFTDQNNLNYMTLGNREYSKIQNADREKQERQRMRDQFQKQSRQRVEQEAERDIQRLQKEYEQFLKMGTVQLKNQTHRY